MALSCCCQYRTWVLGLGFTLGTMEVTLAVVFYTFLEEIRATAGYTVKRHMNITCQYFLYSIIFNLCAQHQYFHFKLVVKNLCQINTYIFVAIFLCKLPTRIIIDNNVALFFD